MKRDYRLQMNLIDSQRYALHSFRFRLHYDVVDKASQLSEPSAVAVISRFYNNLTKVILINDIS